MVHYTHFETQKYLLDKSFSNEERNLLYSLRSRCHPAKSNFKNMYKNEINCSLGCEMIESQEHIFSSCEKLSHISVESKILYNYIFCDANEQKKAVKELLKIEEKRRNKIQELPPGGATNGQDPSTSVSRTDCAADYIC